MGNILSAEVTIEGVRPVLWHKFGPEALPLEKQERTGVAGNDPEEWRRTVSFGKDGQLYFDASYAFATIVAAAKYTKKKMGSIQSMVAATLQVDGDKVLVDRFMPQEAMLPNGTLTTDPDADVYLDIRGCRNPSTKARNVRYRVAAKTGWKATFNIVWDKTVVSRGKMEAVLNDAGKLVGIADGRSIGFGRFVVKSFNVTE